jgi:hypothetical protein
MAGVELLPIARPKLSRMRLSHPHRVVGAHCVHGVRFDGRDL